MALNYCCLSMLFCLVILIKTFCASTILKANSNLIPFKCPPKEHYIVLGNECNINVFSSNNPSDTEYEWSVKDSSDIDLDDPDFFIGKEDEAEFIIYNDNQIGEIHMKLIMDHTTRRKTRCDFKIIFFETPFFGIDLGTTFSCIAYQLRGKDPKTNHRKTEIVTADPNRRQFCIPTAIYFPKNNDALLFGHDAMDMLSHDAANVIYDIKRIIGATWTDQRVQSFKNNHLFTIIKDDNNDRRLKIVIPNRNIQISPEQALSSIVIHLVDIATTRLGVPYNENINAVISIPAFFNNAQRRAVRSIAKLANINDKLLVVEPTAAAIAHTYYSSIPRDDLKLFVTFDFGGGTLDCSVMKCYGMSCDVLAVSGNTALGGIDFDDVIKDIIVDKLVNKHRMNMKDIDIGMILSVAETIKKSLTENHRESYIYKDKAEIIITRKEFELHEKTQTLLSKAIQTLNNAIEASTKRFVSSNIRMILMVGGTSNIPVVLETLKIAFDKTTVERQKESTIKQLNKRFGNNFLTDIMQNIWDKVSDTDYKTKERSIKVEFPEISPDLMVITGSAVLGGALAFDTQSVGISVDTQGAQQKAANFISNTVKIKDVIPLALGFEVCVDDECGKMSIMIARNSRYPLQVNKTYCQHHPNDHTVTMHLFEGNSQNVANNYFLSHLTIRNILPRTDVTKCDTFHMVFNIDQDGIAEIHGVTHNEDGSDAQLYTMALSLLSRNGSLTDCDIRTMRNEMVPWFKSKKLKNIIKTTPCDVHIAHVLIPVKNYVYLDASGSMHDMHRFGLRAGEKVFHEIGPSLLQHETSITVFGSDSSTVVRNSIGHWSVKNIIKRWKVNRGSTYMWHMILHDLMKNHTNVDDKCRVTIITDGEDSDSPSPYTGLSGMDPMMTKLIKSKLKIEVNIVILMTSKWKSTRYKDLCEATGGLFYHLDDESVTGMNRFEKEFGKRYKESDPEKIKQTQMKQQEQYEKNIEGGKATVFDWYQDYNALE